MDAPSQAEPDLDRGRASIGDSSDEHRRVVPSDERLSLAEIL
jgi:hypothetical protein